jgi:hypothetical protein
MSDSIIILGRQPKLGVAELESLYGDKLVRVLAQAGETPQAALLSIDVETVDFARLGGSIKLAQVLAQVPTVNWPQVDKALQKAVLAESQSMPDGKLKLGLSLFGFDMSPARLNAIGLTLKKTLRKVERSVRIVPNKELQLNSAQVIHNNLTGQLGREFLVIKDGSQTIIARTVAEQDIDAYAARDQGRPKRDARVGMLPPKLAQTIVNLATGDIRPSLETVVLDPFCGTGVILQEATLMGFGAYGTDLEPRMIEYTDKNLLWLCDEYGSPIQRPADELDNSQWRYFKTEVGDATAHTWKPAPAIIACEGYLGQPFTGFPTPQKLVEVRSTCNLILKKFLQNIAPQIASGTRLCLAVPAWQQKPGVYTHLPVLETAGHNDPTPSKPLDHLENLGYNRVSFKHVEPEDLIYARADQIVARELLVLIRK